MKHMSPWQFTFFRVILGSYLAVHFLHLIPWSGELFGAGGILGDPALNPAHGLFPNPLNLPLSNTTISVFMGMMSVAAVLLAAGYRRKIAAVVLWFGFSALFHRNNLISNPSIPYVGLVLILTLLVPGGEPWSRGERNENWAMPLWVYRTAWILMAVGYSFSGFTKLASPSWMDGSAMHALLENPLARPGWMRDLLLAMPDPFLKAMTWGTVAIELLFVPLALWGRSRPWVWLALVLMHLGIILVVDFADLSLGMLMIHLFTFDPAWLKPREKKVRTVAFDGECLMCSRSIRFLAKEDREELLRFTPLQGDIGRKIQGKAGEEAGARELKSMLVDTGSKVLDRSSAVLEILRMLGGHWRVLAWVGWLVPSLIRNAAYDYVARRRQLWTGGGGTACALPCEELEKRLLM